MTSLERTSASGEELALLVANERHYRDRYELSPMGCLDLDSRLVIAEANLSAVRMLSVSRSRLIGRPFSDLVAPADQDRWYFERRNAVSGHDSRAFELELERGDGRTFHAEFALATAPDVPGEPPGLRLAFLDVSERRRRELALRAAAAREVLADHQEHRRLADDLRADVAQTLALLGLKVGALQEARPDTELREVANALAELSGRVEAVAARLWPSVVFDLGMAAGVQWLAEEVQREHRVTVRTFGTEDVRDLDDLTRITLFRVLRELLGNAVAHAQSGEVSVRMRRLGRGVCLEVEDSGIGFDVERATHGVGLVTARQQLEQLGGRLDVRSRRGGGTHASAYLDLTLERERHARKSA